MTTTPDPTTGTSSRVRQVEAIANGTVVDHIPALATLKIAQLLAGSSDQVFVGMNLRSNRGGRKGVVKIANRELDPRTLSCLALIAPEATVSIIRNYAVAEKFVVPVPDCFEGVAKCANPNCVTNHERWPSRFCVVSRLPLVVRCGYCERSFTGADLTLI
ncbi:MAG: aspartate carbamoyltransferase regulatory subunit [Planctomycetota bacterium]